jgi:hypothetical protein
VSGPAAIEAALAIAGPSLDELQGGRVALAVLRLDLSGELDIPGVHARAQHFGADVDVAFSLVRDGNLLSRYVVVSPPMPRAPQAIGIELEGPLPGGGFLGRSLETGTYRGAIGVDLGFVVVSGFASVAPGPPISIVAVLAAEFRPPLQLSFGFTLVGVGGVVGINRRLDREQLQAAVTSGALGVMFFPRDPVAEADTVLPALDRCFPISRGDFFAGPMLKLGWGTPTIVSAIIAVIAGSKGTVILGRFSVSLPNEDIPFAVISATVVGVIDERGVSIVGSLINSRIGGITIDGDAAFVLTVGDNATMALSVGGFHPHYKPPPGIPSLRRIGAEMSPLPFASIRLEGYVALTSDSVQFGGGVRMACDLAVANIEGSASFDALIYFSPFRFAVDFRGSISVELLGERIASVGLNAHISGPGRWIISGEVTVGILWWDVDVPIELAWGSEPPEPLATERPLELLRREVGKPENWQTNGSGDLAHWVVLAPVQAEGGALSSIGGVTFTQQAVPLDVELTRIGGRRLPNRETATLRIAGQAPNLDRRFPAGLFFDRTEAELLSGQGLVSRPAGVNAGAEQRVIGRAVPKRLDFEDLFLDQADEDRPPRVIRHLGKWAEAELVLSAEAGAAARLYVGRELAASTPLFAVVSR